MCRLVQDDCHCKFRPSQARKMWLLLASRQQAHHPPKSVFWSQMVERPIQILRAPDTRATKSSFQMVFTNKKWPSKHPNPMRRCEIQMCSCPRPWHTKSKRLKRFGFAQQDSNEKSQRFISDTGQLMPLIYFISLRVSVIGVQYVRKWPWTLLLLFLPTTVLLVLHIRKTGPQMGRHNSITLMPKSCLEASSRR